MKGNYTPVEIANWHLERRQETKPGEANHLLVDKDAFFMLCDAVVKREEEKQISLDIANSFGKEKTALLEQIARLKSFDGDMFETAHRFMTEKNELQKENTELGDDVEALQAKLDRALNRFLWILQVNATDNEYRAVARQAIAEIKEEVK